MGRNNLGEIHTMSGDGGGKTGPKTYSRSESRSFGNQSDLLKEMTAFLKQVMKVEPESALKVAKKELCSDPRGRRRNELPSIRPKIDDIIKKESELNASSEQLKKLLALLEHGHCFGFTLLWLFYRQRSYDERTPDYYFSSIFENVKDWRTSGKAREKMEELINTVILLQASSGAHVYMEEEFGVKNGTDSIYDLSQAHPAELLNLIKPDSVGKYAQQYDLICRIDANDFQLLFTKLIPLEKLKGKMIIIDANWHVMGMFYNGKNTYLFDPNGFEKEINNSAVLSLPSGDFRRMHAHLAETVKFGGPAGEYLTLRFRILDLASNTLSLDTATKVTEELLRSKNDLEFLATKNHPDESSFFEAVMHSDMPPSDKQAIALYTLKKGLNIFKDLAPGKRPSGMFSCIDEKLDTLFAKLVDMTIQKFKADSKPIGGLLEALLEHSIRNRYSYGINAIMDIVAKDALTISDDLIDLAREQLLKQIGSGPQNKARRSVLLYDRNTPDQLLNAALQRVIRCQHSSQASGPSVKPGNPAKT